MDPCPFVRILVGNLAVKLPSSSKSSRSRVHPSSSPYHCKIKLTNFPDQVSPAPLIQVSDGKEQNQEGNTNNSLAACFSLSKSVLEKIAAKGGKKFRLKIEVYADPDGNTCGLATGKLLGKITVPLDLRGVELSRSSVFHNGWVAIGDDKSKKNGSSAELYCSVRAEPDPRFVFQFDGEPECSPQVFQVQGNVKQAVFTCKFGFRHSSDRNLAPRSSEPSPARNWLPSFKPDNDQFSKERKGWGITIHDLSGSPVAMASMVTPYVPSPGSNRVSRSNPGAWLILRPGAGTWKPWGRLETWREPGRSDAIGYKFELFHEGVAAATSSSATVASSTIGTKQGGKFTIDLTTSVQTPMNSPHGSCDLGSGGSRPGSRPGSGSGSDFGFGFLHQNLNGGFVMSSTVEGEGKCSKPEVEVGVRHVTCTEDAAAFVALAAAMDLSMDACRLFSRKLRKELRQPSQGSVV